MNNEALLLATALLPAIVLCIYVFRKDRVEKEPIGLLLLLLVCGAISCIPAGEIEGVLLPLINNIFAPFATTIDGQLYLPGILYYLYHATEYFIGVGLVEELCKFVFLFLVTRKNKNFNSLFDGMIYAIFVSLGFAAWENIMYSFNYGWETAFKRMVTAVPAHMFFGVFMGYYYSWWHAHKNAIILEEKWIKDDIISRKSSAFNPKKNLALCIIIPTLVHGFYDYCCTLGSSLSMIVFYVFLIGLYFYCFSKIKALSDADNTDENVASALVIMVHKEELMTREFIRKASETAEKGQQ